jgi:hypothetical protein
MQNGALFDEKGESIFYLFVNQIPHGILCETKAKNCCYFLGGNLYYSGANKNKKCLVGMSL